MPTRLLRSLALAALTLTLHAQQQGPFETTSLLGQKLYALPTNDALLAAQAKLSTGSPTAADLIALSKAQAALRQYQEAVATDTRALALYPNNADLLLERGHRELGLRQFTAAQKDLEAAVQANPAMLDAHYHLGLALYFQAQFPAAAAQLRQARDLAKSDDSLIDCTAWLYVALRRANQPQPAADALARITPAIHNTEPHLAFYLHLLRFYQGQQTEAQILPPKPAPGDSEAELSFNTVSYGVGNWHLYNGDPAAATPLFRRVVTGQAWNSWGFIGSETELARH